MESHLGCRLRVALEGPFGCLSGERLGDLKIVGLGDAV